jgi:hypothetical protein
VQSNNRGWRIFVCMTAFCAARSLSQESLEGINMKLAREEIAAVILKGGFVRKHE